MLRGRLGRGFRRLVGVVVGHELVLVTAMAVTIFLSAFAVWQATQATEDADDVAAQIRVTDAQQQIWDSRLQTALSHDLQIVSRYCDSSIEYNAALYGLFGNAPRSCRL